MKTRLQHRAPLDRLRLERTEDDEVSWADEFPLEEDAGVDISIV